VTFVGRARPLTRLLAAIAGAEAGQAGLALVSGPAGIGKTSLVSTAVTRSGFAVGWGTCAGTERVPALWPWTLALRGALGELGQTRVGALAGAEVAQLARLLPELSDDRPDEPPDTDVARLRLFDAVAKFLERLARHRRLVVVLDDLQWADPSSLQLLEFVARPHRPVPLALVGAFRNDELPALASGVLSGMMARSELVELRGLSADEVHDLVVATAGEDTAREWSAEIHRRSAGHPFFARQLADLLAEPGARPEDVPPGVRDVVLRRVERLSRQARALVDAAAVAGTDLRADLLAEVTGAGATAVAALVDEATRAGVLVRTDEGHRLAHDLIRETVLEVLPAPAQLALHGALTDALERRHARGASVDPAEVARHSAAAVALHGPDRAVRWARAAAEAERTRLAFDEAAAHLRRARASVEREALGASLIDLLVEEADARARGGAPDRARELLDDARGRARALGDDERLARIALGTQRLGSRFAMPRDAVVAVLEEACSAVTGARTTLEAQLVAALARELHHSVPEHRARARPLSERALRLARDLDDPATLATCLLARHDVLWSPGRAAERAGIAGEIVDLAARARDSEQHAEGLLLRANALLEMGSPGFRGPLTEYLHAMDRLGQPRHAYLAATRRAAAALLDGRLAEATALIEHGHRLGERIGEPDTGNVRMSQIVGLVRARGEPTELRAAAAEAVAHWVGVPSHAHAVAAGFLALAGDLPEARRALDTVTALDRWRADRSYLWPVFVGAMTTAATRLGDAALCAELLTELEPVADSCGVNGALVCFVGSNAHWAGLAAAALGRTDDARRHLEQALTAHRTLGAVAWEAETSAELALLGVPGHAERAQNLAAQLGLAGVAARLAGLTPAYADADAELRRDGHLWLVRHRDTATHLPDRKGFADLATLLARPGRDVHVLDLAGARHRDDDSGPVIDQAARAAYRRRLAELDQALATGPNPLLRSRLAEERRRLHLELASSTGLARRTRALGTSTTERARKAVSARIRDAIDRITAELPELGAHLNSSIITGNHCRYEPDTDLTWRV
jgi:tetratricopeptide (TPR) repeat protein